MRLRTPAATILLAALAGCASCDQVPDGAITDCNAQIVPGGAATDLLFVIDDSGSMSQEQDELSANLGAFIDQLLGSAIALDVQVGVTNTSVEDYVDNAGTRTGYGRLVAGFPGVPGTPYPQGALVAVEQDPQGAGMAGHFLWGTDPAHATTTWIGPRLLASSASSAAALARDFKANVKQGTWGSSREQPLEAMRRALQKAGCPGPNCGFLRSGARLAVVILTDEDDCSGPYDAVISGDTACHSAANQGRLDPLADYVDYLDSVVSAQTGSRPVVGLIAGYNASGTPFRCSGTTYGTTTDAYAVPTRLDDFMTLLDPALATTTRGTRATKASICMPFADTLRGLASQIIPQSMPLQRAPADYRMIAVSVQKASGQLVGCGAIEAAPSAGANVVYTPAPPGGLPTLTFQNGCRLGLGDRVNLAIVCAR